MAETDLTIGAFPNHLSGFGFGLGFGFGFGFGFGLGLGVRGKHDNLRFPQPPEK